MSGTALADPISIGSAIISGLLSVGAAGILPAMSAGLLGSIVLGAGVLGAQFLAGAFSDPAHRRWTPASSKAHSKPAIARRSALLAVCEWAD
ncbi:hypothetical protein HGG76_10565 [Ochrobactrum tritici]|uniref:Uncharacterized protein n=1 Tax=Brucella tritici TaxID=94626 RepID=A0A7X6JCA0_9HYPH|nr:hypothetical protein [Brucella tritici]